MLETQSSESDRELTLHDPIGSTIEILRQIHHLNDGVSVEYEREYDDGAPYPGCKEFWYTYKVVNPNGFEFAGEITKLFQKHSELANWLKCNGDLENSN